MKNEKNTLPGFSPYFEKIISSEGLMIFTVLLAISALFPLRIFFNDLGDSFVFCIKVPK